MDEMKELYNELLERDGILQKRVHDLQLEGKETHHTDGRIAELQLMILRVQQILLANLEKL